MKKLIYTIALLITFSITAPAQWVSYKMVPDTTGSYTVTSMATNGTYLYAGASDGVYKSSNNGTNWNRIFYSWVGVDAVAVNDYYVLAMLPTGYLFKSSNNGLTWDPEMSNLVFGANDITTAGPNVYLCNANGLVLSTNYGTTWDTVGFIAQANINSPLLISGTNLFVGAGYSLYKSTNGGVNWNTTLNATIRTLAKSNTKIFAGGSKMYTSTNNGLTWDSSNTGLPIYPIKSIVTSGTNIFVAYGNTYGVYVSTNNGATWRIKNEGLLPVTDIRTMFVKDNYIYIGKMSTTQRNIWRRDITETIGIKQISSEIPSKYSLSQNFPNPFNPSTKINFTLMKSGLVTLKVYDITGKDVVTLVNENQSPGTYSVDFNSNNLTSGIYFYRLQAGNYSETKRMTLIK